MLVPTEVDPPDFSSLLNEVPFRFPCPHCGHEFAQTFGWLKGNDHVSCPNCKDVVVFDAKQFRIAIEELAEVLASLWASVSYKT